jgi:hypothetical protein
MTPRDDSYLKTKQTHKKRFLFLNLILITFIILFLLHQKWTLADTLDPVGTLERGAKLALKNLKPSGFLK